MLAQALPNPLQEIDRNPTHRESSSTQRSCQVESGLPLAVRITFHTDQQHEKYSARWNISPSKYPISL